VLGVAFCLSVSTLPSGAKAGFIQAFSGNTAPTDGKLVMSTVNFAVLNTTGGAGNDTWKTGYANFDTAFKPEPGQGGSPALDTKAKYLYLYQVTNDWPMNSPNFIVAATISLGVPMKDITSWGSFTGLGLSDSFGQVTTSNFFGTSRSPGNPAKASTGVASPSVVALAANSYTTPFSVDLTSVANSLNAQFAGAHLIAQARSDLFGFTSNDSPAFLSVVDTGSSAGNPNVGMPKGLVPSAIPEPTSVSLYMIGAVLAFLFLRPHGGGHRRVVE